MTAAEYVDVTADEVGDELASCAAGGRAEPDFAFSEQTDDANRYATLVEGRRLTVSFPRTFEATDPGTAVWSAYWEDEHRAGMDRSFHGEIAFKHHVTAYDAERAVGEAARRAIGALPGIKRTSRGGAGG